ANVYKATVTAGSTAIQLPELKEGPTHLRARVTDAAGNEGVSDFTINVADVDHNTPPVTTGTDGQARGQGLADPPNQDIARLMKGTHVPSTDTGIAGIGSGILSRIQETEPNDTSATANPVALVPNGTQEIAGTISSGTDVDFFSFTLTARSGVFFD